MINSGMIKVGFLIDCLNSIWNFDYIFKKIQVLKILTLWKVLWIKNHIQTGFTLKQYAEPELNNWSGL